LGCCQTHDEAFVHSRARLSTCTFEASGLAHDVIGGKNQHRCFRITLVSQRRGDRNRHSRIAPHRFKHDIRLNTAFAKLFGDNEAEI
jgi:hypothetical protein